MVTLQETAVKFNNNLHVSHTGGRLSSDSGLLLVDELMDAFHFEDLIKQLITFKENRRYWTHTNQKILKQMGIYTLVLRICFFFASLSAKDFAISKTSSIAL